MEPKTILLTGATDGIGLVTARMLVAAGHTVLLLGRSPEKLQAVEETLAGIPDGGGFESHVADLSSMTDVETLASQVAEKHDHLDVLINNAGVYNVRESVSPDGLDIRFAVNTFAPYLLTKRLLPLMDTNGRVVNLSSAAQTPFEPEFLTRPNNEPDGVVYAWSKLAITMWSCHLAEKLGTDGPAIIAVNPKSLLASKMVKEAYGVSGHDISIGGEVLCRAALAPEFADATGTYFDNDIGRFSNPHPDALDPAKCETVVTVMEKTLARISQ